MTVFLVVATGVAISFLLGFTFKVREVPLLGFEHSRFWFFDEYGVPFVWRIPIMELSQVPILYYLLNRVNTTTAT